MFFINVIKLSILNLRIKIWGTLWSREMQKPGMYVPVTDSTRKMVIKSLKRVHKYSHKYEQLLKRKLEVYESLGI